MDRGWRKVAIDRFIILFGLVGLLAVMVVVRMVWLQWVKGAELRARGNRLYRTTPVEALRGNILSDDGRLLAVSLPIYRLSVDMVPVFGSGAKVEAARRYSDSLYSRHFDSLTRSLAKIFPERSAEGWAQALREARDRKDRDYRLGNRDVTYKELKWIRTLPFPTYGGKSVRSGLKSKELFSRVTPMDDLARRTVGWQSTDGSWVGLEDYFNTELAGQAGFQVTRLAANGERIQESDSAARPPVEGSDVETTIDVNLQDVATRALRDKLTEHQAEKGTVVVMEVKSGAVKAMVNLTRTTQGQYVEERNIAVGESTNPGSTFKLASLIALLEDGLINLEDSINTGQGVWRKGGHDFRDSKEGGYGRLSVSQVWELSSNVGVTKLLYKAYEGHEQRFLDRLFAMRLGHPLGVTLRGEGKPYIRSRSDQGWSGISLGQIGIGYEVQLTPLQVLTFYNAVANNGCMVRPNLVRALWRGGKCIREYGPVVLHSRICSDSTLRKVRGVLERVVERGTATNLRGATYSIAGKTGTAQVERGSAGYRSLEHPMAYQSSFVGYFPAESPRYSCIVVVYSPSSRGYYGNVVAGPIFREIVDKIYATRREWFPRCASWQHGQLLASKPGHRESLVRVFSELGYALEDGSRGSQWVNTVREDTVCVRLEARRYNVGEVPNVVGLPLQDAIYLMENAGFRTRVSGRGSVRSQSVPAHTKLARGVTVKLEMSVQ